MQNLKQKLNRATDRADENPSAKNEAKLMAVRQEYLAAAIAKENAIRAQLRRLVAAQENDLKLLNK